MRLFTAITFDEAMKDYIMEVSDKLRLQTKGGGFTLRENLHLTLNFIGETNRLELVKEAMQKAVSKTDPGCFTLDTDGFGKFKRREGDICFIGVQKDPTLWKLQRALVAELKVEGFDVDDLEYKPHLTLARRVNFIGRFDEKLFSDNIPSYSMEVSRISLMKSERIKGQLVYTEVYGIEL
jgi:2'-5' RNA ligase